MLNANSARLLSKQNLHKHVVVQNAYEQIDAACRNGSFYLKLLTEDRQMTHEIAEVLSKDGFKVDSSNEPLIVKTSIDGTSPQYEWHELQTFINVRW